ncbi:MAG TPA: CDP-alcohol phosphatidyltransferase family protein [Clostridia bacterium]|nr:CDP-alcohol phosphatidyltransferase family protein [Clostridia bacterium]
MNLPNILTLLRIISVPFIGYMLYVEEYTIALVLFIASGLTDILDGYLARRMNTISSFGKLADPFADKLVQVTALAILYTKGVVPWAVLAIVCIKEVLQLLGGFNLFKKKNIVVYSNKIGKIASFIFYSAVGLSILFSIIGKQMYNNPVQFTSLIQTILALAVIPMLFAFYKYLNNFLKFKKGIPEEEIMATKKRKSKNL